jgi:hypothetical protein
MSCILKHYSGLSLDDFDVPVTCAIRAQRPDELRIEKQDGLINRSFLRNDDGTEVEVLPPSEDPGKWNQLTIALDSGSTGRAGAAFAKHKLQLFIYGMYDIIHRMIRDTK